MAQEEQNNSTSSGEVRTFDKSLNEDVNDFHLPSSDWTQARNAINNSITGDLGKLGNEPGNSECIKISYPSATIIGFIYIIEDKWAVFSTDGSGVSEIGLFKESTCRYDTLVNDSCLDFKLENLIIGVAKSVANCTYKIYWDDGFNPSRNLEFNVNYMDLSILYDPTLDPNIYTDENSTIPWIQNCIDSNGNPYPWPANLPVIPNYVPGCITCTNTSALNCNKIRLALLIDPICIRIERGYAGGNLLNGSYMVAMAYAVKGQKISDLYVSNVQALFAPNNSASALDVFIESVDLNFDEVIVYTIATINQQTVVRQAGIYSTRQTRLSFDTIFDTWPAYPIEQVPIMTPIVNKSDAMYNVGDYLIRVGPTSKEDFNYQPLANQITCKWQSVEYDADYYHKGNHNTGYMRDEVYPFFIQWIYDTGDKSASYHIPGRPAITSERATQVVSTGNAIYGDDDEYWKVYSTASYTTSPNTTLPDGGVLLAEGLMSYWESSEIYPDDKPEIWNASAHTWSSIITPPYSGTINGLADYDLCARPIRHHKFPEDHVQGDPSKLAVRFKDGGDKIRIMGVAFDNIKAPRNNLTGDLIPGIVGYRILRGTRNGNKTVIAKGMINNMRSYGIPGNTTSLGLFPNYPYNDLRNDFYLSSSITQTVNDNVINGNAFPGVIGKGNFDFSPIDYTFHSPETNFNNPFLATKEFRIYDNIYGATVGKFEKSEKHPKEKLITDMCFLISSIGGIGLALLAANGERRTTFKSPQSVGLTGGLLGGYATGSFPSPIADIALLPAEKAAISAAQSAGASLIDSLMLLNTLTTGVSTNQGYNSLQTILHNIATSDSFTTTTENIQTRGYLDNIGSTFAIPLVTTIPLFLNAFSTGTDSIIELIKALLGYRDFAVRYHSHGFYNNSKSNFLINPTNLVPIRSLIESQRYLNPEIALIDKGSTAYGISHNRINNLYRSRTVHFRTVDDPKFPSFTDPGFYPYNGIQDTSRFTGGFDPYGKNAPDLDTLLKSQYQETCSSFYGALKVRIRNQYGQLNNIVQLPVGTCYTATTFNTTNGTQFPNGNILSGGSTGTLFSGDVYINRYTEKNTFFFFYDWLEGQPDGAQLDYSSHKMIPNPKYWANFNQFQTSDFTSGVMTDISNITFPTISNGTPADPRLPSDYYALDGPSTTSNSIVNIFKFDKRGWFYLFNSGVRDFFVESEINTAYREQGPLISEKFFDPYSGSDTKDLFSTAIIKSGNYYKYDISLSITKLFSNYVSWASMQTPQYNPYIAETCYVYKDWRVIYSLPDQYEGLKDGWKVFLPNNYYDFNNVPTCIKPINKSGAIIFFDAASPVQFQGTDQLETGLGTKLTIGDGGLFSQPLQALINVEASHEYGACQNRLSVINTPAGIFWINQNQGKILTVVSSKSGQSIKEVSNINLKWWFASYLPYQIVKDFPTFDLLDNPVIGVACQSVYDNQNGLLYFCKKDYSLKKEFKPSQELTDNGDVYYDGGNNFIIKSTGYVIELGNPNSPWDLYFDDASWTASYDPKTDSWIGWHDWHPNFCLPGKNTFMTVNPTDRSSIWIHNERCDLYCNYYGVDYPFEVEFTVNTGQDINSLRSIQYYLECYKYSPNCYDRFHALDFNFDEATIYNTEQTSGLLKLVLNPKNNPTDILTYPKINPTNINVLFSKVENKYRFNQFWDITEDRGEYYNALIPGFAERAIWDTQPNGYVRLLNANNLNYNKESLQRKKFRHYKVSVLLRKLVSGNKKMLVMLADVKNLLSPR
jgi:hypothetical protein